MPDRRRVAPKTGASRLKVMRDGLAQAMTLQAMGEKIGVTRERVRQLLGESGLKQSKPLYPTIMADVDEAKFIEHAGKLTQKGLAALYGCSVPTIRATMTKLKVPKRKKAWQVRREKLKQDGQLWCTKCETWKSFEQFYRMAASKTGFMHVCTECVRGQQNLRNARLVTKVVRLERALRRALCGCLAKDCNEHGTHIDADADFVDGYRLK